MKVNLEFSNIKVPNYSICVSFPSLEFKKYRDAVEWCAQHFGEGEKMDVWIRSSNLRTTHSTTSKWAWQTYAGWKHIYFKHGEDLEWFLLKWS